MADATRIERDTMGEMTVPADALYGASTQRAVENFPVSGRPVPPEVVHAFGHLKAACARVNCDLGKLAPDAAEAIIKSASEVAAGDLDQHFPVDIFQTGSGTSTNMNANEVIANRCAQAAGNAIGSKDPIHPNDHVNMGQSSNDTFPTAMQIAGAVAIKELLIPALERFAAALEEKAKAYDHITKIGRTHLMDATPVRLGQEFGGFAAQARFAVDRARRAMEAMAHNLPIGGTAVGTGINTHVEFGSRVAAVLSHAIGVEFKEAENHFEAQATRDCIIAASGELKTIAVSMSKIANDIRWLGSGPRCGLFELSLPATQPGSSIMPGKVNPVICESMMQVACQVVGADAAITYGGFGGVGSLLELNVAMPMMADNLMTSINILANVSDVFVDKLLDGLVANEANCTGMVEKSLMMCTSLAPVIGYEKAADVAKSAFKENKTVREYCLEHKILDEAQLTELLDPTEMTHPGG